MSSLDRIWQRYLKPVMLGATASTVVPAPLRPVAMRLLGVSIGTGCHISSGTLLKGTNLVVGNKVVLGSRLYVDATAEVFIGDHCHIGPGTTIISATHTIQPRVQRRDPAEVQLLGASIERGCWIGANVTILAGVTIGEGCVVGAGSVVTRSCTPNGLYVGSPARRAKDLPLPGRTSA